MSSQEQTEARRLTDVELELMNLLWPLGEASVHQVQAQLPPERPLAYTSVSTILRILEQKGVVVSRKEGRTHVYRPVLSREAYARASVRQLVQQVFDGTPSALVQRLVEDGDLDVAELDRLKALLSGGPT